MIAMEPPTPHESGWDEERIKAVQAKLVRIGLARRRLASLDSTLFSLASQLIDQVLEEYEEEFSWFVL